MRDFTSGRLVQGLLRRSFGLWERFGIHVTPNYFESPIPDTRFLKEELWSRRSNLRGIEMGENEQIKLLDMFVQKYRPEYDQFPLSPTAVQHQYYLNNGTFESVDAEILYCMIRHYKPRRIYEIGSGNSTLLSAQALLKNESDGSHRAQLIAFEPSPSNLLKKGFPGLAKLLVSKVEEVRAEEFMELGENDILFLDSSHVLRIGGDVQYEFLDLLPLLKKGVIVHVHDIFLPAEYPKRLIVERRRFFSEQYLLQAFLAFNTSFEVLWAGSFMHLSHPEILEAAFNSYNRSSRWPGSFWMKRMAG